MERARDQPATRPRRRAPRDGPPASALADAPETPFRTLTDDHYRGCHDCLVRYFRGKRVPRHEAQELAQDLLRKAWAKSVRNTQHYLAKRAKQRFLDWQRAKGRRRPTQPVRTGQRPTPPDQLAALLRQELVEAVRAALAQLGDDVRTLVELHYFDDYTRGLIAQLLGVHENTVGNRLKKARERLYELLRLFLEG